MQRYAFKFFFLTELTCTNKLQAPGGCIRSTYTCTFMRICYENRMHSILCLLCVASTEQFLRYDQISGVNLTALSPFVHPWLRKHINGVEGLVEHPTAPEASELPRSRFRWREKTLDEYDQVIGVNEALACGVPARHTHHYKLLAHLSQRVSSSPGSKLLVGIGTGYGTSALALAFARDVRVVTFDEHDLVGMAAEKAGVGLAELHRAFPNIAWHVGDDAAWWNSSRASLLESAAVIVIEPRAGFGTILRHCHGRL